MTRRQRVAFAGEPERIGGGQRDHAGRSLYLALAGEEVGMIEGGDPGEAEAGGVDGRAVDGAAGDGAGRGVPVARAGQTDHVDPLGRGTTAALEGHQREQVADTLRGVGGL